MTIDVGQLVEANDFNTIIHKFRAVYGTGSGALGWGQDIDTLDIDNTDIITSSLINNLRAELINARVHQTNRTIGSSAALDGYNLLPINKGDIIDSDIIAQYNNFVNIVTDNNNVYTVAYDQAETRLSINGSRTTPWNQTITHTITVTGSTSGDGSADNLRYFFNAGGSIKFEVSKSSGSGSSKDIFWKDLLSKVGIITFNHNDTTSSTGSGISADIGFWNLTTDNQQIYRLNGIEPFSTNFINITAKVNTDKTAIIFSINFSDLTVELPVDHNVDGILYSKVYQFIPSKNSFKIYPLTMDHVGLDVGIPETIYVLEGEGIILNETTSNVFTFNVNSSDTTPRTLTWETVGPISAIDFADNTLTGTMQIDSSGKGQLIRTIVADKITETFTDGFPEYFQIVLKYNGKEVTRSNKVNIVDTSVYGITVSATSVYEGNTIDYTINSSTMATGTKLYITIATSLPAIHFENGFNERVVTIDSTGNAHGTIRIASDYLLGDSGIFKIEARVNSSTGPVAVISGPINIIDTSPSYSISSTFTGLELKRQTITAGTGKWSVPAGIASDITAILYSGSGGGGSYHGPGCGSATGHPGGDGGGSWFETRTIKAAANEIIPYVVGAAGKGGISFADGTAGGDTSFGSGSAVKGGTGGQRGGDNKTGVSGWVGKPGKDANGNNGGGGLGGKHRDTNIAGGDGAPGRIELSWWEHTSAVTEDVKAGTNVAYVIATTRVPDNTNLYVTLNGLPVSYITPQIDDVDANPLKHVHSIVGNIASGIFKINSNIPNNTMPMPFVIQLRRDSTVGPIVADTGTIILAPSGSTLYTSDSSWVVPQGINYIYASVVGGGGGAGGFDLNKGFDGYPGKQVTAKLPVKSGQVISMYVGKGGTAGLSKGTNVVGGSGGKTTWKGIKGGDGGHSGSGGKSGAGGGGGGVSLLLIDNVIAVAAGGGGGGGGGGKNTTGYPQSSLPVYSPSTGTLSSEGWSSMSTDTSWSNSWSDMMKLYNIWYGYRYDTTVRPSFSRKFIVPSAGYYLIYVGVDNSVTYTITGNSTVDTQKVTNTYNNNSGIYYAPTTAGEKVISIAGLINTKSSGPGGLCIIIKLASSTLPSNFGTTKFSNDNKLSWWNNSPTILWTTNDLVTKSDGTRGQDSQDWPSDGAGAGGGGAGYPRGGAGGKAHTGDNGADSGSTGESFYPATNAVLVDGANGGHVDIVNKVANPGSDGYIRITWGR